MEEVVGSIPTRSTNFNYLHRTAFPSLPGSRTTPSSMDLQGSTFLSACRTISSSLQTEPRQRPVHSICTLMHFHSVNGCARNARQKRDSALSQSPSIVYRLVEVRPRWKHPLARHMLNPNVLRGRKPKVMTFNFSSHHFPKCRSKNRTGYFHRLS
jgi:hypothetical protein